MSRRRRTGRSISTISVVAVCLLAGGVLTGAQAQPSRRLPNLLVDRPAADHKTVAQAKKAFEPPYKPPDDTYQPLAASIDQTTQVVKKAKVVVDFPKQVSLAWVSSVLEQPPTSEAWIDATGKIYVTSPKGSKQKFGVFPPKTVKLLSFGAIPTSADVHLTQVTQANGDPEPLTLTIRFTGAPVEPPHPLPCSPPTTSRTLCVHTEAGHLTGRVDVRIDNLKVDGVPVDLGPNCHTATPATLNLSSGDGYYSVSPAYRPKDLYIPFGPLGGGPLKGDVNVPAFTGCHNGSEVLDPLLTGLVSGPGNTLTVHQDGSLYSYPGTS